MASRSSTTSSPAPRTTRARTARCAAGRRPPRAARIRRCPGRPQSWSATACSPTACATRP
eukprot:9653808-Heterocapsa_arctica.AAC.1